ncbi:hypothetical protein H8D30_05865 [bacterium]|nr:hypothetical protein [bacterium]
MKDEFADLAPYGLRGESKWIAHLKRQELEPSNPSEATCFLGFVVRQEITREEEGLDPSPFGPWQGLLSMDTQRLFFHETAPTLPPLPQDPRGGEAHLWVVEIEARGDLYRFVNLSCWQDGDWTGVWPSDPRITNLAGLVQSLGNSVLLPILFPERDLTTLIPESP